MKINKTINKGLSYWFSGVMIFFLVELIFNLNKGRQFISYFEVISIFTIYLVATLILFIFSSGVFRLLQKRFKFNLDFRIWVYLSFFIFCLFPFLVLWVNDKNPFTFFSPISIAVNFLLLIILLVVSLSIIKLFSFIHKSFLDYRYICFLSFYIGLCFYFIYFLDLNWQKYRLSVERAVNFFTFNLVSFNFYLVLVSVAIIIISFILISMLKSIVKRIKVKDFVNFFNFLLFVISIVIMINSIKITSNKEEVKEVRSLNVILVIMDAVRSSNLSCYGYHRLTSPNIDKLALDGLLFKNCISNFTHTKTSVPSLLSSQFITISKLQNKKQIQDVNFLQEYLQKDGFFTLLFMGANYPIDLIAGLNQGFDYYPTQWGGFYNYFLPRAGITLFKYIFTKRFENIAHIVESERLVEQFKDWKLNSSDHSGFFAYFDFQNSHSPYHVPENFKRKFFDGSDEQAYNLGKTWEVQKEKIDPNKIRDLVDLYDDSIRYEDECIGELIRFLKEIGEYDNTLLIITADHGDSFLDHGTAHHAHSIYDEIIKVSLIMKFPGVNKPKKINDQVSLIDIMPTILDYFNIKKTNDKFMGESFLSLCSDEYRIKYQKKVALSLKQGNFIGVRTNDWKLVFSDNSKESLFGSGEIGHKSSKELFNLRDDPGETNNVYNMYKESETIKFLESTLLNYKEIIYD